MKNGYKKFIISLFIGFIFLPINTFALSGSVNISCPKTTIVIDESMVCSISGNSSEDVAAISAKLFSSGNINISNISTSSIWQGNGSDGSIELYTDENKIGNFAIGNFTITASIEGSGSINISNVLFTDASFNENSISNNSVSIAVKKQESVITNPGNNTNIQDNSQNNGTNTDISVPNISSDNNQSLQNQQPVISNDSSLKSIKLSDGVINFSSKNKEYRIEVSNEIESIKIEAVPNNEKSKIEFNNILKLNVGLNKEEIRVTAEDGSISVYKLEIIRLERILSSNTNLKNLNIDGYKINFKSDQIYYNLGNINSNSLKIDPITEDKNATVKIIGNNNIGKNDSVIIRVTVENGDFKDYLILVNYENDIKLSNTNIQKNLLFIVIVLFILAILFNVLTLFKIKKKN